MVKDVVSPELKKHIPESGLCLILGQLGSGKSALGYALLDEISRASNRKAYVHGFPRGKAHLLPRNISTLRENDPPEDSVVLFDEAYYTFYAREHYSQINKRMGRIAGLARQKGILCIYISQEAGKLDINIRRGAQVWLIKPLSTGQIYQDKPEIRGVLSRAAKEFGKLETPQAATYVISGGNEFMVASSNNVPRFWTERLSRAYEGVSVDEGRPSEGKKTTDDNWPPVQKSKPLDDIIIIG